ETRGEVEAAADGALPRARRQRKRGSNRDGPRPSAGRRAFVCECRARLASPPISPPHRQSLDCSRRPASQPETYPDRWCKLRARSSDRIHSKGRQGGRAPIAGANSLIASYNLFVSAPLPEYLWLRRILSRISLKASTIF